MILKIEKSVFTECCKVNYDSEMEGLSAKDKFIMQERCGFLAKSDRKCLLTRHLQMLRLGEE